MDNIYDTLAKLNKVANAPEIVKEDSNALMKKGLEDLMKKTKLNKDADYKPFGKGDKDYETGLPKDAKKDPMEENTGTLKDAARQGVMARLAELAGLPVQEIEEALGTPQDVAAKIMAENPLDEDARQHDEFDTRRIKANVMKLLVNMYNDAKKENGYSSEEMNFALGNLIHDLDMAGYKNSDYSDIQGFFHKGIDSKNDYKLDMNMLKKAYQQAKNLPKEMEEGNEFSGARDDAIKAGKDSFEVDGKTYPVKGDKNESLEESPAGDALQSAYDKVYNFVGQYDDAALEYLDDNAPIFQQMFDKYDGELDVMASKLDADTLQQIMDELNDVAFDLESGVLESKTEGKIDEGYHKGMMQDVEEGMSKAEFAKKYPGNKDDYDDIKKEIEEMNEDKVEETTTSGSVATSEGSDKPAFANASIYENNEIVKRAAQLNEGMNITVSAGSEQEPSINISAQGEEAAKLAQLLKLAGMGMAQPGYSEVQVEVAEDQEFANGADDTNTMDTEYMTQDIAGGLNGPKKMAYPKVAGGDNPMSVLGESELNEVSEDHLMKLYQEYKAK